MRSFVFAVAFSMVCNGLVQADQKPNVLFISIDDLNDWLGCYGGHTQVETPNIDALARRGVVMSNAHCQAPICNPSRVSMFLGKLPSTTGMYFLGPGFRSVEPTKNDETLFQTFRRHGYFVSTRGKIFHGKPDPASFDHIEKATGWRRDNQKLNYRLPGSHPLWDWGKVDTPDDQQRDYLTADWAASELPKLAESNKPFFLAVGFHLPHVPIYASKKWFDMYPIDSIDLPAVIPCDREDVPEIAKLLTQNPTAPRHKWMVENQQWRLAVQSYLATISFVDHLVGMVLEGLETSGVTDETVVVLWSDHGFHLGEKLRWAKRTLWEETTRVPLILAGRGIKENSKCSRPVGLIDIYPTLLDLCDLPDRADLEGTSLRPLLTDPMAPWEKPAISTFGPNNHSLRDERYRYTIYADGSQELYDHQLDPAEWHNLALNGNISPEHAAIIERLGQWLPVTNAKPLPGSAGSDSPLYGEGSVPLSEAMKRSAEQLNPAPNESR